MVRWANEVKDELPTLPAECAVRSGEIMYVPAGYRHGIINTADSIGVAFQAPFDAEGLLVDSD
jgi:oxalate decarboxylase/phosphoglucose isomerase-like protein (cupin superfamily)